jgi:hypothetical protein
VESKIPNVAVNVIDGIGDISVPPFSGQLLLGKLHLVDLAGGERINRSKVKGDALKGDALLEARFINKSLLALGKSFASRNFHIELI